MVAPTSFLPANVLFSRIMPADCLECKFLQIASRQSVVFGEGIAMRFRDGIVPLRQEVFGMLN
jgi:hypothetical protein